VVASAGVAEAHPRVMLNALLAMKTQTKRASEHMGKAAMEATQRQHALQSYVDGMAGVAVTDRQILAETKLAEEQAKHLLRGTAAAPKVAHLLKHGQQAGKNLVANELRSIRKARSEAALLSTGLQGGFHIEKMQEMQQELQIARQRVASLMTKHPKVLHKVDALLHTASRMVKHAGVAHSLQQRANARVALLARQQGKGQDASGSEVADGRLQHAEGMATIIKVDKGIMAATGKAKEEMKQVFKGENEGIGFEAAQLLNTAQNVERNIVAMESHDAHNAASEAGQLLDSHAHVGGEHRDLTKTLTDIASSTEDDVEGLLRSMRGSTLTQEAVARRRHQAVLAESSNHLRAKLRARLQPVKRALAQHLGLAMRQSQLAERGEDLAIQLQDTSNSIVEELQDGPDPVDRDVVVELQKHLGAAEKMLNDVAFFHEEMASDIARKARALVSYSRTLVRGEQRHDAAQFLQQ